MNEPVRVLVLGTGQMGSGIARLVLEKPGLELAGAFGRRAERSGTDLGHAIGLSSPLGLPILNDLKASITQGQPDIAIQATCSRLADAEREISLLLRHGVNVISIAEEMAYPAAAARETAERLDRLAVENNVAMLGTGINPGFILDTLVILLTGVCSDIHSIRARRVNDLAPYGPTVLAAQGVGLTPDEFDHRVESGTVVGHIGFAQSVHMIAASVGWDIDRLVETRKPIVSSVQRETPFVRVEPGQVAGCLHTAVAYRDDRPVITLEHPQQIRPQLEEVATGDRIEIRGTPDIRLSGHPEVPGGEATIALTVNMIPRVLNAGAGLHTMADLPIPAAMLADARRFVAKGDSR